MKFWTFTVTLTLKTKIYFFTQNTLTYNDVPPNSIWLQKDQQFSRYSRNSHIWSYEPSLWPWTWRQQARLLARHSAPWWCITIPSQVTKGSAIEEISSRWTFIGIFNLSCDTDCDHNRPIHFFFTKQPSSWWCAIKPVPVGSPAQCGDVVVYVKDINQLILLTPVFFKFCSCVCFCLYDPFNCISFYEFSQQLSNFSLCSSSLSSAILVL